MLGPTAAERIRRRNDRSGRIMWIIRVPFLGIVAIASAIVWFRVGGIGGAVIAGGIVGIGIWVALMNPWKKVRSV